MEARVPVAVRRVCGLAALAVAALVSTPSSAAEPTKQQCIAANEEGQDLRRAGKLRDAAGRFRACMAPSCPKPVRDDCGVRLDEVEQATPTVGFVVKDARGAPVPGAKITMDGAPLAQRADGEPVAVEPGEHLFQVSADGFHPRERRLAVREGAKAREEVFVLEAAGATAPDSSSGSTQRTVGFVVGGVGLGGLAVGAVFGVMAKSTYDDARATECGGTTTCTPKGRAEWEDARGDALVSTIGFVAGGVLLVGGALLYLTAPKERGVSVATSGAGLVLRGRW